MRARTRTLILAATALAAAFAAGPGRARTPPEDTRQAAEAWFELSDSGASWGQVSPLSPYQAMRAGKYLSIKR